MISQELLKDMGFEKGSGWDHEVWYHECDFWVHFGGDDDLGMPDCQIYAGETTRPEFFKKFMSTFESGIHARARICW